MLKLRVVDSHAHFFLCKYKRMISKYEKNLARTLLLEFNEDVVVEHIQRRFKSLEKFGIKVMLEGILLMPPPLKELAMTVNKDLIAIVSSLSNGLRLFPSLYMSTVNVSQISKILGKMKAAAIKIYDENFEHPFVIEAINQLKLPVIFHNPFSFRDSEYSHLLRVLDKFADMHINVQLAHIGRCYNTECLYKLSHIYRRYSNIFFDLSTVTNAKVLEYAIENFPKKVMYGSDLPYTIPYYEASTIGSKLILRPSNIEMYIKHFLSILDILQRKSPITREWVLRETFFEFLNNI